MERGQRKTPGENRITYAVCQPVDQGLTLRASHPPFQFRKILFFLLRGDYFNVRLQPNPATSCCPGYKYPGYATPSAEIRLPSPADGYGSGFLPIRGFGIAPLGHLDQIAILRIIQGLLDGSIAGAPPSGEAAGSTGFR